MEFNAWWVFSNKTQNSITLSLLLPSFAPTFQLFKWLKSFQPTSPQYLLPLYSDWEPSQPEVILESFLLTGWRLWNEESVQWWWPRRVFFPFLSTVWFWWPPYRLSSVLLYCVYMAAILFRPDQPDILPRTVQTNPFSSCFPPPARPKNQFWCCQTSPKREVCRYQLLT